MLSKIIASYQMKKSLKKEMCKTGLSYHIYSVGIDCSTSGSHHDHNGSHDNHHTLYLVAGIVPMGTKVHCILVLQQDSHSPLEQ